MRRSELRADHRSHRRAHRPRPAETGLVCGGGCETRPLVRAGTSESHYPPTAVSPPGAPSFGGAALVSGKPPFAATASTPRLDWTNPHTGARWGSPGFPSPVVAAPGARAIAAPAPGAAGPLVATAQREVGQTESPPARTIPLGSPSIDGRSSGRRAGALVCVLRLVGGTASREPPRGARRGLRFGRRALRLGRARWSRESGRGRAAAKARRSRRLGRAHGHRRGSAPRRQPPNDRGELLGPGRPTRSSTRERRWLGKRARRLRAHVLAHGRRTAPARKCNARQAMNTGVSTSTLR